MREDSLGHVLKLLPESTPWGPLPPMGLENEYDFISQDAGLSTSVD